MPKSFNTLHAMGFAAAALALGAPMAASAAPNKGWVHVGSQRADFKQDRDVFQFDRLGGQVGRFRFEVQGRTVAFYSLKLVYEDGGTKVIALPRRHYSDGDTTRAFRNPNPDRQVAYVEVGHRTQYRYGNRQALVKLHARKPQVAPWPQPQQGHVLGSLAASRHWKSETLNVGFERGRFRALKLRARNRSIKIDGFEVTFGNGRTQYFPTTRVVLRGGATPELDLKGRRRFIDQITLRYRRLRGLPIWRTNTARGFPRRGQLDIIGIR